jgi:hypothetical protein
MRLNCIRALLPTSFHHHNTQARPHLLELPEHRPRPRAPLYPNPPTSALAPSSSFPSLPAEPLIELYDYEALRS